MCIDRYEQLFTHSNEHTQVFYRAYCDTNGLFQHISPRVESTVVPRRYVMLITNDNGRRSSGGSHGIFDRIQSVDHVWFKPVQQDILQLRWQMGHMTP